MKKNGFTMIEMMLCLGIILVILTLVIPNITSKNKIVRDKGCDALLEVINGQILLFEINEGYLPHSVEELMSTNPPYISKNQSACPNGKSILIEQGQAYAN